MGRSELTDKWKKLKKDQILIVILVGVLLLVIALPHEETVEETSVPAIQSEMLQQGDTAARLERELREILEQVQGVGRVQVMITMKSSGKKTVEKDRSVSEENRGPEGEGDQTKRTEETAVFERDSQGNEIPFVIEETAPVIEGVLVAAQGGDNLTVAENISEAAMVLFGVDAHKIKVMKLN